MDRRKNAALLLMLASAMTLGAARATAPAGVARLPSTASVLTAADALSAWTGTSARRQLHAAVRGLEQAALQTDFASNDEELALLQSAHDRLLGAARSLCCAQRARALRLAADIDHVIVRDSARLGALVSPDGDSFGPPAPTRNQLAQLATEGRDLLRNVRPWHPIVDSDDDALATSKTGDVRQPLAKDSFDLAFASPVALPPNARQAAPQFRFRF